MTTYQMVAEQTHTTVDEVKKASREVIGKRHYVTTEELNKIIILLKEKEGTRNEIK